MWWQPFGRAALIPRTFARCPLKTPQHDPADTLTQLRPAAVATMAAVPGSGRTRALERYFGKIDQRLDSGRINDALRLSAALPEICSALEHPKMRTSSAHCICWCDAWVAADCRENNVIPLAHVYMREGTADVAQALSGNATFASAMGHALLAAARTWYRKRGAYDLTVQENLGKL